MTETVTLRRGTTELVVSRAGGGIVSFQRDDQALMRAAPTQPYLACFPMLPFCSRIHEGRFNFAGQDVELARNFLPEPHTIHGFGWQAHWHLHSMSETACTLKFHHDQSVGEATGWPWLFSAEQRFELVEQGLLVTVTLENQSDGVMPAGMGLHPYFPLTEATAEDENGTTITLLCNARVQMRKAFLPQVIDLSVGRAINVLAAKPWRERDVDDVFAYGLGVAQIHWRDKPYSLSIESDPALPHWIVLAPRGAGFICIEPISHFPNVVNVQPAPTEASGGLKNLAPSEVWSTCTTFHITPSAAVT